MRKLLLLTIAISLFSFVQAQVVITSADMPVPNDIINMRTTTTVNGVNFKPSGANRTWNFSTLTSLTETIDTFVTVTSANPLYLIYFSSATVAVKQSIPSIPLVPISDGYSFQKNSTSQYSELGVGITIMSIPLSLKFDNPDVRYKFPITFGTKDSSNSKYSANIPGLGYYGEKRKRVNFVDGWGTLYLPNDTFSVMRVKSIVQNMDSIYLDTLGGIGFSMPRNVTEYKWLTPGHHEPVLQIDETTTGITVKYYSHVPFSSINENKNSTEQIKLYPNPATDKLTVTIKNNTLGYNVSVMDITGNVVLREYFDKGNEMIVPVNNLVNGLYFITFENSEKRFTRKFVKE